MLTTVRKMLSRMGENYFDDLIELKRADNLGQSDYNSEINRERIDTFIKYHNEIMENQDALTIKDLKITGKDLIDAGIKPGPDMGRILKILLEIVLNEPEHNDHEWLLDKAMKLQEK
jgi:tRNA nucleotidyltransferase (CCA-adding enzyme)